MTSDPRQRLVLNAFRGVGSLLGVFVVTLTALPLVRVLGMGNERVGFALTAMFFAFGSITINLLAFTQIRERVDHEDRKTIPLSKSIAAARGNWPWLIIVASNLLLWIGYTCRTSTLIFYAQYNLQDRNIATLLQSLSVISIASVLLTPLLSNRLTQSTMWVAGLAFAAVGQTIIALVGHSMPLIIVGWIIANLGTGLAIPLPFAMLSIAVDFGRAKTGISATGLLSAIGASFCIKAGSGLGGFIPSLIMNAFGYHAGSPQTSQSLLGIWLVFLVVPTIIFLAAMIPLCSLRKYELGSLQPRDGSAA